MPKEEWGTKRVCPTTGKRFYDLNKSPIVSPYTGEVVNLDQGNKSRVALASKPAAKAKETEESENIDLVDEADEVLEEDNDVDIDDDLLEEDEEDNVSLDDIADVASDDEEN